MRDYRNEREFNIAARAAPRQAPVVQPEPFPLTSAILIFLSTAFGAWGIGSIALRFFH